MNLVSIYNDHLQSFIELPIEPGKRVFEYHPKRKYKLFTFGHHSPEATIFKLQSHLEVQIQFLVDTY